MPRGLRRFHESQQSHFVTFSCYHRQPKFNSPEACDLFVQCLEEMRHRFAMRIYGYVVMPEHVHILVSEPEQAMLADAMHFLKLSFAKRLQSRNRTCQSVPFWQKRYYDRNVRDALVHSDSAAVAVLVGRLGAAPAHPASLGIGRRGVIVQRYQQHHRCNGSMSARRI